MQTLNQQALQKLAAESDSDKPCLSLLAPMQRAGRAVQQNPIHWGNVINEAEHWLQEAGLDEDVIKEMLAAPREKLRDDDFWQHQREGLAYFSRGAEGDFYQTNASPDPQSHVGEAFLIAPVAQAVSARPTSYILACSPKRVRLLQVNGETIEDLEPENFPTNLREALNIDEYVDSLQHHSTSRKPQGGQADAVHHGHGGSDPDVRKQDELLQFFHRLDAAIDDFFGVEDAPLIFAGVEYLFPIFKEACDYRNLYPEPITGNPDDLKAEEILQRAQPLFDSMSEQSAKNALEQWQEKSHSDWASDNREEITKAATLGQVDSLLVGQQADVNETNPAIVQTLTHGGKVVFLPESISPEKFTVGAIYRTPAGTFLDDVKL